MIEIRNLSFGFEEGKTLLQISHLNLFPGQHLAILGPSGSGKSSLLRLMAGLLLPDHGEIWMAKNAVHALDARARRLLRQKHIHYLSQEGNLLADLNLRENLLLPLRISGLHLDPRELISLCEDLGIAELMDRLPHRCSGGERQKASLARALLHPAPIILADEPTSHLPPAERKRCLELAIKKIEERNRTLVMVTHNHEALELFTHTIEAPFMSRENPS